MRTFILIAVLLLTFSANIGAVKNTTESEVIDLKGIAGIPYVGGIWLNDRLSIGCGYTNKNYVFLWKSDRNNILNRHVASIALETNTLILGLHAKPEENRFVLLGESYPLKGPVEVATMIELYTDSSQATLFWFIPKDGHAEILTARNIEDFTLIGGKLELPATETYTFMPVRIMKPFPFIGVIKSTTFKSISNLQVTKIIPVEGELWRVLRIGGSPHGRYIAVSGEKIVQWGEKNLPKKVAPWFAIIDSRTLKPIASYIIDTSEDWSVIMADCNTTHCAFAFNNYGNYILFATVELSSGRINSWQVRSPFRWVPWRGILHKNNIFIAGDKVDRSEGIVLQVPLNNSNHLKVYSIKSENTDMLSALQITETGNEVFVGGVMHKKGSRTYNGWLFNIKDLPPATYRPTIEQMNETKLKEFEIKTEPHTLTLFRKQAVSVNWHKGS